MEREPDFLNDLERSLVDGVGFNVRRTQARRRLAAGGVAVALVAVLTGGFLIAARDGDEDLISATSPPAAPTTAAPTTITDSTVDSTDPSTTAPPSSSPPSTSAAPTSSSTSTSVDPTTTTPPTATTTTVDLVGQPVNCAEFPDPASQEFPLRQCSSGWGVVWVRNALEARGEVFDPAGMPNEFSAEVDAAVRRFQAASGLEVDGLVGEDTWFAMYPHYRAASGQLTRYDLDNDGRIEPSEVAGMGDSNSICDFVGPCPPPVTDLRVESGAVGEPMTVSWTPSPGAVGYRVFATHDRTVHETQGTTLELPTDGALRAGDFAVVVESVPGPGGQGEDASVDFTLTYNEALCLPAGVDASCVPR